MRFLCGTCVAVFAVWCAAGSAYGAEGPASSEQAEFFEKRVRPILVEHCYECHAAGAEELGGGLRLDSRDGWRHGGDSGPAILPLKPAESLLVRAVRYDDDALKMPPKGKLKAEVIADLERWIADGAVDPRSGEPAQAAAKETTWDDTLRARRQWWSLQPVRRPDVPPPADATVGDHPIDRFLADRRRAESLALAEPADPYALVRRLGLVLTGLPPTADDAEAFACSYPPSLLSVSPSPAKDRGTEGQRDGEKSYEAVVDGLLASPAFGERWARHWLDVVRFSETHGNEWNYEVHHAWRYRDYVVRAFNADVPFDQLVREHVAGDLLANPRRNAGERFNESVIGTAFYRFGEVSHDDCIGLRQIGYDIVDNQLDTLTKAFQATTVACARCHDHKIDAVSTRDYYALLGILRSSRAVGHTIDDEGVNRPTIEQLESLKARLRPILAEAWRHDGDEIARYVRAAAADSEDGTKETSELDTTRLDAARLDRWRKALAAPSTGPDDPLDPLRTITKESADGKQTIPQIWSKQVERFERLAREQVEASRSAEVWADFRRAGEHGWEVDGQGLQRGPTASGEAVVEPAGEKLVATLLPAGYFTHVESDRLNGTLRSPPLPDRGKFISFHVAGRRSAAVRLLSNNCQLNYKNYRALTNDEPAWVTFPIPEDRSELRNYVELMTLLDNPKFPDQLSALGGDKQNYRLPWDEAAGDRRSYFGVTHVVLHEGAQPPPATLTHLRQLLDGEEPQSIDEVAERYRRVFAESLAAWADGRATDDDVRLLAPLVRHGLVRNTAGELPAARKIVDEYRRSEAALREPRVVPGLGDFGSGADQAVLLRGDWRKPGPTVPRGYLEALDAGKFSSTSNGSGRLELAERIASATNPLTARVYVNRVWHHLFGAGLVRTVDDFGRLGEQPSHPELLDYLAARFVEEGWSTKRLIRLIVTSRAFRAASAPSTAALGVDPENRLLSHYPARRLEGEAIRDALLAASGRLDPTMFGPSVQPYREKPNADRRLFPGPLDGAGRRSLYVKCNLMESPKFLGAFNLPGGKVAQGRRDASHAPAQALAMLNDPLVLALAEHWAERLCGEKNMPLEGRTTTMFRTAYGRPPSDDERARFAEMIGELAKLHGVGPKEVATSRVVWRDAAHALFLTEEFVFVP